MAKIINKQEDSKYNKLFWEDEDCAESVSETKSSRSNPY